MDQATAQTGAAIAPAKPHHTGAIIPAQPLNAKQAELALAILMEAGVQAKLWARVGTVILSLQRIADGIDIVQPAQAADAAVTPEHVASAPPSAEGDAG